MLSARLRKFSTNQRNVSRAVMSRHTNLSLKKINFVIKNEERKRETE